MKPSTATPSTGPIARPRPDELARSRFDHQQLTQRLYRTQGKAFMSSPLKPGGDLILLCCTVPHCMVANGARQICKYSLDPFCMFLRIRHEEGSRCQSWHIY